MSFISGKLEKIVFYFNFNVVIAFKKTVPHYTYLGIPFDEYLTFVYCIRNRTCASSRAFGKLISTCHSLKDVEYNTYCQLYDSLVEPVQDYASQIWGFKKFRNV